MGEPGTPVIMPLKINPASRRINEQKMKKIIFNTVLALGLVLVFSCIWEFAAEPYWFESGDIESNAERWEYVITVMVFCFAALVIPTLLAIKTEKEKNRIEKEREKTIAELQKAVDEIKTLRGIIPICMYCKKIQRDMKVWDQLEVYLEEHTDADFTHGVCPDCFKKHKDEIEQIKKENK